MRKSLYFFSVVSVLFLLGMSSASQAFTEKEQNYQQCLLEHQPKVQLEQVVARVRQACDKVYRDNLMLPRKKEYFQCVLNYLPQVETDSAVQDVLGACASRHDFRR
jgi:hypothetical protein